MIFFVAQIWYKKFASNALSAAKIVDFLKRDNFWIVGFNNFESWILAEAKFTNKGAPFLSPKVVCFTPRFARSVGFFPENFALGVFFESVSKANH